MKRLAFAPSTNLASSFVLGASLLFSVFLAGLIGLGGYLLLPLVLGALAGFALLMLRPVFGILLVLCMVYSVLPTPPLGALGGKLFFSDIAVPAVLVASVIRDRNSLSNAWRALGPVLFPLALLAGLAVVSLIHARFILDVSPREVYAEARPFVYWLLVPAIVLACTDVKRLHQLTRGTLAIAAAIVVAFWIQHFFDIQLLRGRLEEVQTLGQSFDGVVRIQTAGIHIVVFSFLYWFAKYALNSVSFLVASAFLIPSTMALIFTFGRTTWAGTLIGFTALCVCLGWRQSTRAFISGFFLAATLLTALWFARPDTFAATIDRALSISSEIDYGSSFAWRKIENRYAIAALQKNLLLGIGLGNDYKPVFERNLPAQQARHIHSGFMYLALKLGVFALIIPPLLLVGAVVAFLRVRARPPPNFDLAVPAAAVGALCYPMFASVTQPEWFSYAGVSSMALFVGLLLAHLRLGAPATRRPGTQQGGN